MAGLFDFPLTYIAYINDECVLILYFRYTSVVQRSHWGTSTDRKYRLSGSLRDHPWYPKCAVSGCTAAGTGATCCRTVVSRFVDAVIPWSKSADTPSKFRYVFCSLFHFASMFDVCVIKCQKVVYDIYIPTYNFYSKVSE